MLLVRLVRLQPWMLLGEDAGVWRRVVRRAVRHAVRCKHRLVLGVSVLVFILLRRGHRALDCDTMLAVTVVVLSLGGRTGSVCEALEARWERAARVSGGVVLHD